MGSGGGATILTHYCGQKRAGKIGTGTVSELPKGTLALGHTRWATHGGVTEKMHIPTLTAPKNCRNTQWHCRKP